MWPWGFMGYYIFESLHNINIAVSCWSPSGIPYIQIHLISIMTWSCDVTGELEPYDRAYSLYQNTNDKLLHPVKIHQTGQRLKKWAEITLKLGILLKSDDLEAMAADKNHFPILSSNRNVTSSAQTGEQWESQAVDTLVGQTTDLTSGVRNMRDRDVNPIIIYWLDEIGVCTGRSYSFISYIIQSSKQNQNSCYNGIRKNQDLEGFKFYAV